MVQVPELFGVLFGEKIAVAETEYRDQQIVRSCDQPHIRIIVLDAVVSGNPSFDSPADDLINVVQFDIPGFHPFLAVFGESVHINFPFVVHVMCFCHCFNIMHDVSVEKKGSSPGNPPDDIKKPLSSIYT